MGLFTGLRAMSAIHKIKKGGKSKLSYAMISMLIINLPDAKNNLSKEKYKEVLNLYLEFQKCTTLFDVDIYGYKELCEDVIRKFDAIAPYQLYCGANQLEFSIYMDDFHIKENEKKELLTKKLIDSYEIDEKYIQYLIENNPMVTHQEALEFYKILIEFKVNGKHSALQKFESLINNIEDRELFRAICVVPFFIGALVPNGVLTQAESTDMTEQYRKNFLNKSINS